MESTEICYYCHGTCTSKDRDYKTGAASYYLCENCGLYGITDIMRAESKYNSEESKNICAEWLKKNNKSNITEPYIISTDTIREIVKM